MKLLLLFALLFLFSFPSISNSTIKDSLLNEIYKSNIDTAKANLYIDYARTFMPSQLDSAFYYTRKGIALVDSNDYPVIADLYGFLGVIYFYDNNIDSFQCLVQRKYNYAVLHKDTARMSESLLNVSIALKVQGRAHESLQNFLKIDSLLETKDNGVVAHNNLEISDAYLSEGQTDLALDRVLKAITYYEKHDDTNNIVMAYYSLATIYVKLEKNTKAISAINYCRNLSLKLKGRGYISDESMQNNIGFIYMDNSYNLDSALIVFSRLIHSIEDEGSYNMCLAYVNLGVTYYKLGDLRSAIHYYRKAINNKNAEKRKKILNAVYVNIGQYYININNDSAYYYLNIGAEISKELGNNTYLKNAYANLLKLDSVVEDFELLSKHQRLYYKLIIELDNIQSQEKISELLSVQELKREKINNSLLLIEKELQDKDLEKKTYFNYLSLAGIFLFALFLVIIIITNKKVRYLNIQLTRKSKYVNKQNRLLDRSNKDKDMFLGIIAHDLKNPIGSLSAYLSQVKDDFEEMSNDEIKTVIDVSQRTADNTFNLLNNLLVWGKTQSSNYIIKKDSINFELFMKSLNDGVFNLLNAKNISMNIVDVDKNKTIVSDKNALETILRNYISNAIKYTPNGGIVDIYIEENNNKFRILVKDNGVGVSKSILPNLFSHSFVNGTKGTDNEESNSIGLKIVATLAKKIGAKVGVSSEEGEGSVFWVEINNKNI